MRPRAWSLSAATAASGAVSLAAVILLVWSRAPLGSPLFFAAAGLLTLGYVTLLARVRHEPSTDRRALGLALLVAVLLRLPLALAPVGADNDMERYLWDGRVQALGYNPYAVTPADPAMAATHTAESIRMPSRRAHTPYPPAAQLFFRLVVSLHDSLLAMKLALVTADLLTIVVLHRWLVATGRSEWLTMAYAWNPLVILEVAHSGHIDALGAFWVALAALCLTRRRTGLAALAFVLAVTTKLLPIVLAPLLVGRIRLRDAAAGAALAALLYWHFLDPASPALGALPSVVDYIRFNGPVFLGLAALSTPRIAAGIALAAGLGAAVVARLTRPASDPEGWAWPMAIAVAGSPVIYPWYLLFLTPFLWTRRTLPLLAWCLGTLGTYIVWSLARQGGRWTVPWGVQVVEYLLPLVVAAVLAIPRWRRATSTVRLSSGS